jgi:hypothetical protein
MPALLVHFLHTLYYVVHPLGLLIYPKSGPCSLDGVMGARFVKLSGLLVVFYFKIKTSSRHLSARPKVGLAVLVDIPDHLSHFR